MSAEKRRLKDKDTGVIIYPQTLAEAVVFESGKNAEEESATKQDKLVSGTNIKTVNNTSLLGSGNVAVQPTLVSGTNIKTVNNTSLLGAGNLSLIDTSSTAQTKAGTLTSQKFITNGGTSSQFVKGDGSLDNSGYLLPINKYFMPYNGFAPSKDKIYISTLDNFLASYKQKAAYKGWIFSHIVYDSEGNFKSDITNNRDLFNGDYEGYTNKGIIEEDDVVVVYLGTVTSDDLSSSSPYFAVYGGGTIRMSFYASKNPKTAPTFRIYERAQGWKSYSTSLESGSTCTFVVSIPGTITYPCAIEITYIGATPSNISTSLCEIEWWRSRASLSQGSSVNTYPHTQELWGNLVAPMIVKRGGTSSQFLKADGSVDSNSYATTSDLATKQNVISDLTTIRTGAAAGATAYQKPSAGIPKSDMTTTVQASLDLADSAVQAVDIQTIGGVRTVTLKQNNETVHPQTQASLVTYLDGTNGEAKMDTKVDKVVGKGLSTNDYSDAEKNKLADTYTKQETNELINAITAPSFETVATLPATGQSNVIYLVGPTNGVYDQYIYSSGSFVKIGTSSIDLTGYVTTAQMEAKHVLLSESEYEALETKDPDKIYMVYEDE